MPGTSNPNRFNQPICWNLVKASEDSSFAYVNLNGIPLNGNRGLYYYSGSYYVPGTGPWGWGYNVPTVDCFELALWHRTCLSIMNVPTVDGFELAFRFRMYPL